MTGAAKEKRSKLDELRAKRKEKDERKRVRVLLSYFHAIHDRFCTDTDGLTQT